MIPAQYYFPIFLHIVLLLSFFQYVSCVRMNNLRLLYARKSNVFVTLLTVLFILIVGLRPVSFAFGDTGNYAQIYYLFQAGYRVYDSSSPEWLFDWLMAQCAPIMDVKGFFLIVEIGYAGLMYWACRRLIPNNLLLAMLFCFGAFSFFTFGTNGIRNGLACSFVLLALSFVGGNKREKIIAGALCFAAYHIHHSTVLPILCMVVSLFYKNTKMIYLFWFGSIVISAVAGGAMESLFTGLGFDDRLDNYLTDREDDYLFSHTGFRWDFLLYSAMPIWLGWYVVMKRKIYNRTYLLLLHTYIMSNAFWVMLIRAAYSNRFAYLSWFMYPIVLAYPLLVLPVWDKQGRNVGRILVLHALFTYFMWLR